MGKTSDRERQNTGERFIVSVLLTKKGRSIIWKLIKFAFLIEAVAFLFDLCPLRFCWPWLETVFLYDRQNVVPVVAIMWSTVCVPIAYLLTQSERKCYGVKLADLMMADKGFMNTIILFGSLGIQLMLILLAAMYDFFILFTVVAWVQILYVFLAFYLVGISQSYEANKNIIEDQSERICKESERDSQELCEILQGKSIQDYKVIDDFLVDFTNRQRRQHWLLTDMIKNIDYSKTEEVDSLKDILKNQVCMQLKGIIGCKIAYELFSLMLEVTDKDIVCQIINEIFRNGIERDARKGILYALIIQRDADLYDQINIFMRVWKDSLTDGQIQEWEEIYRLGYLWVIHQGMFVLNKEEETATRQFAKTFQNYIQGRCVGEEFNKLIWESCLDMQVLMKIGDFKKMIENLFLNDLNL